MKAAIYCRVSSEEQVERGNIENQVQYAKRYIDLHGPENNITEFEFYLDEGVSGTLPLKDRPEGRRLLQDAQAGKFAVLFVYRLDRLARSVKHVLDTYELLEDKKIALKSMTEAFDTGTPTGKFFMTLLASIAALERDTIMERTQLGKERKAREGKWVSGAPPYGYRIGTNGSLEVYEPEADIVRRVFSYYNEGNSTIEVAKYLNARKIPTPAQSKGTKNKNNGLWNAGHISIILRSKIYIGEYEYLTRSKRKKDVIEVEVPSIIDKDLFYATDKRLAKNSSTGRNPKDRQYLLKGIIYCRCGRRMVGNRKGDKLYYRCSAVQNQGHGKKCNSKQIRAVDIEGSIWADVEDFIRHPEKFAILLKNKLEQSKQEVVPTLGEIAQIEKEIVGLGDARARIISMCSRNLINDQEAEKELGKLAGELNILEERKNNLLIQQMNAQIIEQQVMSIQVAIGSLQHRINSGEITETEKADAIKVFTKRVVVETFLDEAGKKQSKAIAEYTFSGGESIGVSRDSYRKPTLSFERVWDYKQVQKKGCV